MVYVTRLSLRGRSEEERERIIGALAFCSQRDRYGTFKYTVAGGSVFITSPDRDTAFKRGSYFKKRFGVFYNIIKEET
jgi:hypothetical protein